MHSWPITVFAPISTTPSWQRIFDAVADPDEAAEADLPTAADLQFEPAAEEEQPGGLPAAAGRGSAGGARGSATAAARSGC